MNIIDNLGLLLVNPTVDTSRMGDWKVTSSWERSGSTFVFAAKNLEVSNSCRVNPESIVEFPVIIQGVQKILVDGQERAKTGDTTFKVAAPSYNSLVVPCAELNGAEVEWQVFTQTGSLATISEFPVLRNGFSKHYFFAETLNVGAAVMLPIMAVLFGVLFYRKIKRKTYFAAILSTLFYGLFFLLLVPTTFSIRGDPNVIRPLGDIFLWCGTICTVATLMHVGVVKHWTFTVHWVVMVLAIILISIASTLDGAQLGSTVAYIGCSISMISILFGALRMQYAHNSRALYWINLSVVLCFVVTGFNDFLFTAGLIQSEFLFPAGVVASTVLLTIHVNQQIDLTYAERDHLRANLESEVQLKTAALRTKTEELESVLEKLKKAQAETVSSAKLATLGTMAAGVAHQLGNTLNAISAANMVLSSQSREGALDNETALRLSRGISDALTLSRDIIESIGAVSRGNDSFKVQSLFKVVQSGIDLTKGKSFERVKVENRIDSSVQINCIRSSLTQVFMNLISNAIDAITHPNGLIVIEVAKRENGMLSINITDNGHGIPQNLQAGLFRPFVTSKDAETGTGLGLYLAKREVDAHKGRIHYVTGPHGTTFTVELPEEG